MPALRPTLTAAAAAAAAALLLAAAAPAADAPAPVVKVTADVVPGRLPIPNGTPMTLTLHNTFKSDPPGGNFVLQKAVYLFGAGARFNAKLFPSCSVAKLRAAKGRLSACPRGSRIGSGTASGTAVALGISSTGKLTFFNGPGGRSITVNFSIVRPAAINATFSAAIQRLHGGRYTFKLSVVTPPSLQTVLGGDIVVSAIHVTTGATLMIDGVRRGYFEALNCPRNGSVVHADFTFNQGAKASAETTAVC